MASDTNDNTADHTPDRERQAEAVFAATLDVPTADRPAAIAAACGDDVDLRRRVDALADALRRADGFLSDPTAGDATIGAGPPLTVAPIGERPGDRIGPYHLLEQIGEGGFGVVFKAEQERPVRRLVALKVIKLGMDTREVVARFEAERQALAMMDHPNIARVFDAGSTAAGRPYFVMELVRGSPITEYADKHKLTTADRVALAVAVCRAVQHAHSKGIIHRDLKPTNVLVMTADDKPVPKVIDFGIAKATQSKLTERTLFTAHRQLIGTPQYMSPEQADSDGVDVDTRTDVYSLGVVLYELLVGTTPLDARSLRSAAFEAMRRMIRDAEPARPSTRLSALGDTLATVATNRGTDARQLSRQLHGELDWIVMRSLEKDRSRRYDTAAALADDLNRYLAGEAVLAGPVSGAYRLRKALRRHRAAVLVGVTVAAALLLGMAGTTAGLVQAKHQRAIAQAERVKADAQTAAAVAAKARADEKERTARATLDFLTTDVLQAPLSAAAKDEEASRMVVRVLLEPAMRSVDEQFKDQPETRAEVQGILASTLSGLRRYDLAVKSAKAAWDAQRAASGDDSGAAVGAMGFYGNTLLGVGRYAEGIDLIKRAYDRSRLLKDDGELSYSVGQYYAEACRSLGRHAEAADVFKRAWDQLRPLTGDAANGAAMTQMLYYAEEILALGRAAEASDLFKRAWDASRQTYGDDNPGTISVMTSYGQAEGQLGHLGVWLDVGKQAFDRSRRVVGPDHPDTLRAMLSYALALRSTGHVDQATDLLRETWERNRQQLGEDNALTKQYADTYAEHLMRLGRYAEATVLYKQGWDFYRRSRGEDDRATLGSMVAYGDGLRLTNRNAEAVVVLKEAWDRGERALGANDPVTSRAMDNYGSTLANLGRTAEAVDLAKRVWDRNRQIWGDDHLTTLWSKYNYASNVDTAKRYAEAESLLRQVVETLERTPPDNVDLKNSFGHFRCTLGTCLWEQHKWAEAEPFLRQAAEDLRTSDPNNSGFYNSLSYLADCLAKQQKWAAAEPVLREDVAWEEAHAEFLASAPEWTSDRKLLDECLAHLGKPPLPTTSPATAPATRP